MAILVFVLSLILLVAGAASGYASLDLLPTGLGVLYAMAGAVAASAAVLTFALAVAIWRIDALARLIRESVGPAIPDIPPVGEPAEPDEIYAAPALEAEAPESFPEPLAPENESPININRVGHLPSLETVETALEAPRAPPNLVGSYSSGGANYKIFADGSIEAETPEGTLKFASMGEFKGYLIEKKGERQAGR
jgi:hypothetical protein